MDLVFVLLLVFCFQVIESLIPLESVHIKDVNAQKFLRSVKSSNVQVSKSLSDFPIKSSYGYFKCLNTNPTKKSENCPYVLLHGFDSSCLEYRNIVDTLSQERDVYVPDLLGWGFNDVSNVKQFSPEAKVEHVKCFLEQVINQPCVLVGASLVIY